MNINWLDTATAITEKDVSRALLEAIWKRLPGAEIKKNGPGYWSVDWHTKGFPTDGADIRIVGTHRVTFHPGGTMVGDYVEFVLRSEVGVRLDGTCGGEHDPTVSWKPDPSKWPTWDAYWARFGR